eukprot:scaffold82530_cov75-Attheya_sp.AAC.1
MTTSLLCPVQTLEPQGSTIQPVRRCTFILKEQIPVSYGKKYDLHLHSDRRRDERCGEVVHLYDEQSGNFDSGHSPQGQARGIRQLYKLHFNGQRYADKIHLTCE